MGLLGTAASPVVERARRIAVEPAVGLAQVEEQVDGEQVEQSAPRAACQRDQQFGWEKSVAQFS